MGGVRKLWRISGGAWIKVADVWITFVQNEKMFFFKLRLKFGSSSFDGGCASDFWVNNEKMKTLKHS